mmetsp:Transcript_17860/g.17935  ORF Transcript_17860/g.17935 Transcript_17860/m.17935 type:complete len:164 (-) Transcript_17860:65-556(-)|eukprot:CAMPEP_0182427868 /NCGR_PEP_ID=MMETSP1167-20130531/20446_1 /TAXON_ID=2988 /ORGANISM="Mallomonas Sp, Strain CCMP3275" /LENGTH=163 /DNA_ID=CAMNT_0024610427 /DNA_START=67 /DNA_END=558 /DNA_ORIENTATION=-
MSISPIGVFFRFLALAAALSMAFRSMGKPCTRRNSQSLSAWKFINLGRPVINYEETQISPAPTYSKIRQTRGAGVDGRDSLEMDSLSKKSNLNTFEDCDATHKYKKDILSRLQSSSTPVAQKLELMAINGISEDRIPYGMAKVHVHKSNLAQGGLLDEWNADL